MILAKLSSRHATPDDEEIVCQRRAIETSLEIESAGGPFKYSELLQGGKIQNLRRMVLCGMVNMMQQFTGSNMVCPFDPTFYTGFLTTASAQ